MVFFPPFDDFVNLDRIRPQPFLQTEEPKPLWSLLYPTPPLEMLPKTWVHQVFLCWHTKANPAGNSQLALQPPAPCSPPKVTTPTPPHQPGNGWQWTPGHMYVGPQARATHHSSFPLTGVETWTFLLPQVLVCITLSSLPVGWIW